MRRWSREAIASEIWHLTESGQDLSYSNALVVHTALFRAAVRAFGSWRRAVEHCGVEYAHVEHRRRWTRAAIVEAISVHAREGADLSWSAMRRLDPTLVAAARKPEHFGSWQRALEAAGVPGRAAGKRRTWDDETVVAAIRQTCGLGAAPRAAEMAFIDPGLLAAARRRFGSWHSALTAAGRADYAGSRTRRGERGREMQAGVRFRQASGPRASK